MALRLNLPVQQPVLRPPRGRRVRGQPGSAFAVAPTASAAVLLVVAATCGLRTVLPPGAGGAFASNANARSKAWAVEVSEGQPSGHGRRELFLPVAAGAAVALAPPLQQAARAVEVGEEYTVEFSKPIGRDIFFCGGRASMNTMSQYNGKIAIINKNSPAYAAGARIGDEIMLMGKGSDNAFLLENSLRMAANVDKEVKSFVAKTPTGGFINFKNNGVVQPGEKAPAFTLNTTARPDEKGSQTSLSDLLAGGKRVVVAFRPGSKYFNGDLEYLKAWNRAYDELAAAGAEVVLVSLDRRGFNKRLASAQRLKYQLLSDDGSVAKAYGALLNLPNIQDGNVCDRKTFVIGPNGVVENTFVDVEWEPSIVNFGFHLADVGEAVGADRTKVQRLALNPPKSLGEFLSAAQPKQDASLAPAT